MPKYVIERDFPGAGNLSKKELKEISQTSCKVLEEMGTDVQWVESYMTDNKVFCVYISPNEELIKTHASKGGFPITAINKVSSIIDLTTAE